MIQANQFDADQAEAMLSRFDIYAQSLDENSLYYESDWRPKAVGMAVPPEMQQLIAQVGWPRVYLDSLEERLDVEGFRLAGQSTADERLWSWWQYNNLDEQSGLAHLECFIHGRSYITISAPDPDDPLADQDTPVIRVESANTMWVDTDARTGRVKRAIRVYRNEDEILDPELQNIDRLDYDRVTVYLPNSNIGLKRGDGVSKTGWLEEWRVDHDLGVVTVVPMLNRRRITDRYGKSEITSELRSVTDAAARIMMNLQGAAELMALPQRYIFGLSKEEVMGSGTAAVSAFRAYMGRMLAHENHEVNVGQFQAAELRNYLETLDQLAKQAATYTGLPPQYLTIASDNPASAEAIRSSETRLVKKSERKQRILGGVWEQVMRIAMLVMEEDLPKDAHRLETVWRDPATPTFSAKADAVQKLVSTQTADGRPIIPVEQARIELNYSSEQRRQMDVWDKESPRQQFASLLAQPPTPPQFSSREE
jgi:hypothetical protein